MTKIKEETKNEMSTAFQRWLIDNNLSTQYCLKNSDKDSLKIAFFTGYIRGIGSMGK